MREKYCVHRMVDVTARDWRLFDFTGFGFGSCFFNFFFQFEVRRILKVSVQGSSALNRILNGSGPNFTYKFVLLSK